MKMVSGLAITAALSIFAAAPAQARYVTTVCEGKISGHSLSAYTTISAPKTEPGEWNMLGIPTGEECIFVTKSKIGNRILKVCPENSQCSLEADINNTSGEWEILTIISINRIDTPAQKAAATRDKAARDKKRWAAINPYKEKVQSCVVKNLGREVTRYK
jgi:hypothetical protein